MADSGLENLWDTDFDGNGVIGQSALKDADSNGLADHKVRYTILRVALASSLVIVSPFTFRLFFSRVGCYSCSAKCLWI